VLTKDVALISVDDHVVEPPPVWVDRLPRRHREAGPHIEAGDGRTQWWMWEGRVTRCT
jgi:hypothetical protein